MTDIEAILSLAHRPFIRLTDTMHNSISVRYDSIDRIQINDPETTLVTMRDGEQFVVQELAESIERAVTQMHTLCG